MKALVFRVWLSKPSNFLSLVANQTPRVILVSTWLCNAKRHAVDHCHNKSTSWYLSDNHLSAILHKTLYKAMIHYAFHTHAIILWYPSLNKFVIFRGLYENNVSMVSPVSNVFAVCHLYKLLGHCNWPELIWKCHSNTLDILYKQLYILAWSGLYPGSKSKILFENIKNIVKAVGFKQKQITRIMNYRHHFKSWANALKLIDYPMVWTMNMIINVLEITEVHGFFYLADMYMQHSFVLITFLVGS